MCLFCDNIIENISECVHCFSRQYSIQEKFELLLNRLSLIASCNDYIDDFISKCVEIYNHNSLLKPLNLKPVNYVVSNLHKIDNVAIEYLENCSGLDSGLFVPIDSIGDYNCLYSSIRLLVPNCNLSTAELRVRTIVELTLNYEFYNEKYIYSLGGLCQSLKDL